MLFHKSNLKKKIPAYGRRLISQLVWKVVLTPNISSSDTRTVNHWDNLVKPEICWENCRILLSFFNFNLFNFFLALGLYVLGVSRPMPRHTNRSLLGFTYICTSPVSCGALWSCYLFGTDMWHKWCFSIKKGAMKY